MYSFKRKYPFMLMSTIFIKKKKTTKSKGLLKIWRNRKPSALLVGMQTGIATVENDMVSPQKIKNGTAL